jgi:hypothetical protein
VGEGLVCLPTRKVKYGDARVVAAAVSGTVATVPWRRAWS